MARREITATGIRKGVWHGRISGVGSTDPAISVLLRGEAVAGVTLTPPSDDGDWRLAVPIPPESIQEGLQTFVICDDLDGETLGSFAVLAGQALGADLQAEVDLLRAEIDMLKRAFRRHCADTD
ncbi:hypothetical protein R5H30_09880 [Sulfitobacter sp. D35]|uniref:hypothetical protein n=1 Tax=Sulfitobacter sp. D35 TaxID=3083252 RepID=UPI00296EBB2E|nr:hypothetical protein [Sulfitobacter sp. D35]MDW4498287.1 hypothetical protein [Sulfitobacter sp. D35]